LVGDDGDRAFEAEELVGFSTHLGMVDV